MARGEPQQDGLGRVLDASGLVTDADGHAWVVDGLLGRGSWGTSFALKGHDGTLAVLKIAHDAAAFASKGEPEALAEACARTAEALRQDLEARRRPFLPRLLGTVKLKDGTTGLITPRYVASLESRLAGGMPLVEAVGLVVRVLRLLSEGAGVVHGNLRPSNVLLDDAGAPVLADPAVEPLAGVLRALERTSGRPSYLPPEVSPKGAGRADASVDTWALCLAVHRAAALPGGADEHAGRALDLPREGLGRVQLAMVKDAAAARLKAERANKRFASRAVARLGAVLARGLSPESDPSPPYRFRSSGELIGRLVEVDELLRPAVESVSRLMLGAGARDRVFEGTDAVSFTVNVGTTAGVTAQDDLAVGVQLVDRDAPGDGRVRVADARFTVEKYPSGKWRFEFVLPDVAPGRFHAKVAFAIKDSTEAPVVAEGDFEVRPRPGYVPPERVVDDVPSAIPISGAISAAARRTELRDPRDDDDDDGDSVPGAVVELAALRRGTPPRPIRPSDEPPSYADDAALDAPVPSNHVALPERPPVGARVAAVPPLAASVPSASVPLPPLRTAPAAIAMPPRPAPLPTVQAEGGDWTAPRVTSPSVAVFRPAQVEPAPATRPGVSPGGDADLDPFDAFDPALSDYPSPTHPGTSNTFTDLPAYDDVSVDRTSAVRRARSQFLQWFRQDPWTAGLAIGTALFVFFMIVITLVKSFL